VLFLSARCPFIRCANTKGDYETIITCCVYSYSWSGATIHAIRAFDAFVYLTLYVHLPKHPRVRGMPHSILASIIHTFIRYRIRRYIAGHRGERMDRKDAYEPTEGKEANKNVVLRGLAENGERIWLSGLGVDIGYMTGGIYSSGAWFGVTYIDVAETYLQFISDIVIVLYFLDYPLLSSSSCTPCVVYRDIRTLRHFDILNSV